jgi:hypothetical protein
MTAATLKARTLKDLAALAKRTGISGSNTMSKENLIRAILRNTTKSKVATTKKPPSKPAVATKSSHAKPVSLKKPAPVAAKQIKSNGLAKLDGAAKHNGTAKLAPKLNGTAKLNGPAKINETPKLNGAAKQHSPAKLNGAAQIEQLAKQNSDKRNDEQRKRILKKLELNKVQQWEDKNLAKQPVPADAVAVSKPLPLKINWPNRDRLVVMVRGPFWLHATWDLTPAGVQRAQAALGQDWHSAKPVLRLIQLSSSGSSTSSERVARDIPIHGGVKNWFIDVNKPPQTYRIEIGYLSVRGKFFCLARSNTVTTPPAQNGDSLDTHWGDIALDVEKIYALSGGGESSSDLQDLFEEKTQRPLSNLAANGHAALSIDGILAPHKNFKLEIDAEIVLRGSSLAGCSVNVQGEPIKVHSDGSFSVRMDFPNRRQVIPIVATSKDGVQHRTVVLAIERNTKAMEAPQRESAND